jgi:hypothetical protein
MGVRYTVKGADFSGLRPINYVPDNMGFTGWFWHGETMDKSLKNWANPSVPALIVGPARPALMSNFIQTLDTTGWLNSQIAETVSLTLYSVARVSNWAGTNSPTLIASSNVISPNAGALLDFSINGPRGYTYFNVGGVPTQRGGGGQTQWDGTPTEAAWIKDWTFYAISAQVQSASAVVKFYNMTHNDLSPVHSYTTDLNRLLATSPYFIGGNPDAGRGTAADLAFTGIANVGHTDDQVSAIYRQVKGAAGRRGINI